MATRIKSLMLVLLLVFLTVPALQIAAQDNETTKQHVIQIVAESDTFKDWLASHPKYQSNASGPDDNGIWYVEFYDESGEEWLGYANVNANTGEIQDSFAPKPLSTDVYQEQLPLVTAFALADEEVLARLNHNPKLWDMYPDWNRWDATWDVYFMRGIDGIVVKLKFDENNKLYMDKIVNPNELDADKLTEKAHNDAIQLAYVAAGMSDALKGHDTWKTYVEHQDGDRWSVSFVDGDTNLITVIVDLKLGKLIKVKTPDS